MLFRNRQVEPRPLSAEELELAALDDQIRAQERMLNLLRSKWECLGRVGRRTEEGIKLEVRISALDVKIINLKLKYEKKRDKYGYTVPVGKVQETKAMIAGRLMCVVAIISIVVGGLIWS